MSNEGSNSDISCRSTGGGQIRYKKALKEISKLVSMNTSLKKELQATQQNLRQLEDDYDRLFFKYEELANTVTVNTPIFLNKQFGFPEQDGNINVRKKSKDSASCIDQQVYVNIEKDNENLKLQKQRSQLSEAKLMEQIKYLQGRVLYFENAVQEKEQLIHQLELSLEKKHLQIIEVEGKCEELNDQLLKSKDNNKKSQQRDIALVVSQELMKEKKRAQQLEILLRNAESWNRQLTQEVEQLKKKMFFISKSMDCSTMDPTDSLHMPNIVRINSTQTEGPRRSSHFAISLQKQKVLEEEINRLRRLYNEKRQKYKTQIMKLKQENEALNQRISSMNCFIEKQQFYIQNYVASAKQAEYRK